jgi:AraC-like DNA-binding protein
MKPALRQITGTPQSSFLVRRDLGDRMLNNWHYHPEIELLYIRKSKGTWIVGDHIGPFQDGDLLLIGANLPHCFRHEYEKTKQVHQGATEAICVKFVPDIFGQQFLDMPEARQIKELLAKANAGLKLTGKTKKEIPVLMEKMVAASPGKKLVYLLAALEEIAENKDYQTLSSKGFLPSPVDTDRERIKQVFEYTFNHFSGKISIGSVAALLNMTRQSFCRYFKNKTQKTYVRFLMEVRIGYACRLLVEDEKNVAEISYDSGYNNISHFNHQFKLITGKKPLEYKKDYLKSQ